MKYFEPIAAKINLLIAYGLRQNPIFDEICVCGAFDLLKMLLRILEWILLIQKGERCNRQPIYDNSLNPKKSALRGI